MAFSDVFRTGFHNTLRFISNAGLSYKGTVVTVFSNTIIDTWPVGEFTSASYEIAIEYGPDDVEYVNIHLSARVNQASIMVYGRTNLGRDLIQFTATADTSKVSLIANPLYAADGTTALTSVKLIYRANYAERINPVSIPTTVGETTTAGGEAGVALRYNGTNLPNGFLQINDSGSIVISNIRTITAPTQSNLEADFILSTLNIQNTDGSIAVTTNNTTKTLTLTLSATPYLSVTNSITATLVGTSVINNVNIGQITPLAGRFTVLSAANISTFSPNNNSVNMSPLGTGRTIINPTASSSIENVIVGATIPSTGQFSSLTLTTAANNNTQLIRKNELLAFQLLGAI
jgi:hypothetical protein